MMQHASVQSWVRWWCDAWQGAHGSWRSGFAEHAGLALSVCEQVAQRQPETFMRFAGMMAPQPPAPDTNTLQWLALQPSQRQLALAMVEHICTPGRAGLDPIDGHAPWCRSLAKALRPGLWLQSREPGAQLGVCLLEHWIGPHCWARLRLCWPVRPTQAWDITLSASASGKLHTLWSAVLWRVIASTPDIPEVSNAG
ncbi:type III secretion protein [Pseudomonas sp. GL-B-16]|uniref:type III secretion protein n=1 Tax=Pseudomonas sp. GL-B-16 TaxID=2832373 RepID=UPI001CBFB3AB|nr:type III secretion protein [Pseudomonas sp. GL-B-16]